MWVWPLGAVVLLGAAGAGIAANKRGSRSDHERSHQRGRLIEMAGPYEAKLDKATNAQPVVVMQAADTWKAAAEGLGKVAEQIDTAKRSIAAAWKGDDADAATAAFTSLSDNVRQNQKQDGAPPAARSTPPARP